MGTHHGLKPRLTVAPVSLLREDRDTTPQTGRKAYEPSMKTPRHIIWMTSDHMRWDCLGAHGNPAVHTPNLDALIGGGVSFSHCYANNPLCMPSRASFMTGCYPPVTGVLRNGHELRPDFEPVVAREFAKGGYQTAQIGKLHFQGHEDVDLDPRPRADYGFEVFRLSEEPGCYDDAYIKWLRGERPDLVDVFSIPRPTAPGREARFGEVLDAPWEYSHSGWVAEQACRHLFAWGGRPGPQFAHLGFYAPHPPLNPTRAMFAPYENADLPPPSRSPEDWNDPGKISEAGLCDYRRHFYAMITGIDLAVGRLIEVLKNKGVFEDTLLVFSSDHGDLCGDHGRIGKNSTFYDGIMRVPLVLHWPEGLGREARTEDGLTELVDVLPTLLDLAGIRPHPLMQGRSLAPSLRSGESCEGRSEVLALHGRGELMLRERGRKYLRYPRPEGGAKEVLYDLENDPGEFHNRAEDPAFAETLHRLRERALARTLEAACPPRPPRLRF